jgi:hypothetical protein
MAHSKAAIAQTATVCLVMVGAGILALLSYPIGGNGTHEITGQVSEVPGPSAETTPRHFVDMDTRWLDTVHGDSVGEPTLFVIRSQDELVSFRDSGLYSDSPRPEVPQIDFDKELVVALVDVSEPSTGYSIQIDELEERPDEIVVRATKLTPNSGYLYAAMITYPRHVITTSATDKPFILSLTEKEAEY